MYLIHRHPFHLHLVRHYGHDRLRRHRHGLYNLFLIYRMFFHFRQRHLNLLHVHILELSLLQLHLLRHRHRRPARRGLVHQFLIRRRSLVIL